jgi:tRNA-Thr(GGU) m(6)t(6)A37 methyltransferase TsaA
MSRPEDTPPDATSPDATPPDATPPEYGLPEEMAFHMEPVGVMHSPYQFHPGTPRQPAAETSGEAEGVIVLRTGLQNLVRDLDGFSHIWVLFWFNYSRGWNHTVRPPRDGQVRGLYATRAPHRPNPIGLSVVPLKRVEGRRLTIGAHDILNGSPILDIKPYVTYADSIPDARCGWVDELGPGAGPDHRDWRTEKGYVGPPHRSGAPGVPPQE